MRLGTPVAVVTLAVLAIASTPADSLLMLWDGESGAIAWPGTRLVSAPVHSGQFALEWRVSERPGLDSPHFIRDWTAFDELRFWAYVERPVNFSIPLVFVAPGGYYFADWKLDWHGWKEHRIRFSECRPVHSPAGWDKISSFGFRSQGYGQPPVPEGLVVVFDDFALHSPRDLGQIDLVSWMAKERRERVVAMKASGNPYYLSVLESLQGVNAEPSLPEQIRSSWVFSGLTSRALAAAWAAGWEESPRRGDKTLIAHASALIDFCLKLQKDGSWFYSRKWEDTCDPNSDRFALGPLMDAVYWVRKTPEGERNWKQWEASLRQLVDFQYEHWGRKSGHAWSESAGRYPNQDVFHLFEMAMAYEFWRDEKYLASARDMLDGLEAHLLRDGGFNYIGPETEIPCYHDLNVLWIARYYRLTGDERARRLLAKTVNYYPLTYTNDGRPEYYTDCWWKHYWSDGAACGPEIIAGITGDAYNKWLADRLLERVGPGSTYQAIYAGMFYRDDVEGKPLPDQYVRLDGNIGGPRGRFGSWYFAGVTGGGARDTFVGAMVGDARQPGALAGAFLAANIEVAVANEGPRDRTSLYVSGPDDRTSFVVAPQAGVVGARYWLRKPYINSVENRSVPRTPWRATQVWLLTKQGLVGLVELEAEEEQTVPRVLGELRFGPDFPVSADDTSAAFRCGAIKARLLEHNFARVDVGPARPGYAQSSTRHSAVLLTTEKEPVTAVPGRPYRYAVFVAPGDGPEDLLFRRLEIPGVFGFMVKLASRNSVVIFNPGDAPAHAQVEWAKPRATAWRKDRESVAIRTSARRVGVDVGAGEAVLITEAN